MHFWDRRISLNCTIYQVNGVPTHKFWSGVLQLQCVTGGLLVIARHIACCNSLQIINYSLFISDQSKFQFGRDPRTSHWVQLTPSSVWNGTKNCDALSRCLHRLLAFFYLPHVLQPQNSSQQAQAREKGNGEYDVIIVGCASSKLSCSGDVTEVGGRLQVTSDNVNVARCGA